MPQEIKKYSNGEITIVWQPSLCIHSRNCWQNTGLPKVFDPKRKPWIDPNAASSQAIIQQVKKCPSGALSILEENSMAVNTGITIETVLNGPLLVKGDLTIKHHAGHSEIRKNTTAFCRCGHSANKPYCDGSHHQHKFENL